MNAKRLMIMTVMMGTIWRLVAYLALVGVICIVREAMGYTYNFDQTAIAIALLGIAQINASLQPIMKRVMPELYQ